MDQEKQPQIVKIEGSADVRITSYGVFINNKTLEKLIQDNMGQFDGRAIVTIIIEEEEDDLVIEGSNKNAENEVIQD